MSDGGLAETVTRKELLERALAGFGEQTLPQVDPFLLKEHVHVKEGYAIIGRVGAETGEEGLDVVNVLQDNAAYTCDGSW